MFLIEIFKTIEKEIYGIKKGILKDFKERYGCKYDENNVNHVKDINNMIHEDIDKYVEQYQNVLNNYDMEAMFI